MPDAPDPSHVDFLLASIEPLPVVPEPGLLVDSPFHEFVARLNQRVYDTGCMPTPIQLAAAGVDVDYLLAVLKKIEGIK